MSKFRIIRGVGASAYSQFVQIAVQLAAVPVFATHWGVKVYGVWLMLFTVPSYLALADFGFAMAAANDMTMNVARGEKDSALATFQGVRALVLALGLLTFTICAAILFVLSDHLLVTINNATSHSAKAVVLILVGYGLVALQNNISMAGFRSTGQFATGTFLLACIVVAENVAALTAVIFGRGILEVAATYLLVRVLGGIVLAIALRIKSPWLMTIRWRSSLAHIRALLRPAIATMALPGAQALFLQGTIIVVGMAAGNAAVPAFSAVRTLSRAAIQFATVIYTALMPEFSISVAVGDRPRMAKIALACISTALLVLLAMFPVVVVGGKFIVRIWTHGSIAPSFSLILVMAIMMVINGAWHPIATLILATNKHGKYSYRYLIYSFISVIASYPLVKWLGSTGAGISLVLLDCAMLARVWKIAIQLNVLNVSELKAASADWQSMLVQAYTRLTGSAVGRSES